MTTKPPIVKRLLIGCGIVLLIGLAGFSWCLDLLMKAFSMQNQVYQEVRSPDGRYVATLAYSDGMTYGYYFVTLASADGWHPLQPDDPIPHDEVAEVAAEGLNTITWVGSHKLVVDYNKSGTEQAQFVIKNRSWRDIRIAYHGS